MVPDRPPRGVTQADVARKAGVSRSMVSYVLNSGSRSVAPETRERILAAIAELGYRPNKHAQNLMRARQNDLAHRQFGIVLSEVFMLRRPYYADILAGIHRTAHANDHRIQFIRFFDELKDPVLFNSLIHNEEVSGLILIALDQHLRTDSDRTLMENIRERIGNIVCVDWQLEGVPSVSFDRQDAAFKATTHLLSLGRRDLVYIGQQDNRVFGFRQALTQHDMTVANTDIRRADAIQDGYDACSALLAHRPVPDGIVGGSDEVSIGVLRKLNEQHIRVPEDLAIVSIDNIEVSEFCIPPLTTVNVQTAEMGSYAVQVLIDHGTRPRSPASIVLPTQLVVRASCGQRPGAGTS